MKALKALLVVLCYMVFCAPAFSDVIYENGSFNGTFQGAQISPPQKVSDSFTVSAASLINKATVGLWVPAGSAPVSLTWSIGAQPFGTELGSGTAALANILVVDNGDFFVYLSTFDLNASLTAGDYWFTLSDASSTTGDPVGWDINFGPSSAFFRNNTDEGPADSEYFRLEGMLTSITPSPVPEPISLSLFSAGLLSMRAIRRKQLKKM